MSATTEEKTSKKVWLSYIPLVLLALTFILPLLFMLFFEPQAEGPDPLGPDHLPGVPARR